MKRPRLTLSGQILLWFFLNLALVAAVLLLVLKVQFRVDPRTVLSGRTREQFRAAASLLSTDLRGASREAWKEIVASYDEAYGVQFAICRPDGRELLEGGASSFRGSVRKSARSACAADPTSNSAPGTTRGLAGGQTAARRPGGPSTPAERWARFAASPRSRAATRRILQCRASRPRIFYVGASGEPRRYLAAATVGVANREFRHPPEVLVVASSATLGGNEIFCDWRPWLWAIAGVLLVSALIWLPFVGRVSRRLRRLTRAAESISEGDFKVEVASRRTDELGRLSRAVQSMADRLDDYMAAQKRFLGDIAHELCSPLARLRMSVGVLETRIAEEQRGSLASLNAEAEAFSQLVNELLDFSRASLAPGSLPTHEVSIPLLLQEVADREGQGAQVKVACPPDLWISTNRDVLRRALANVVRNANRYAGEAGPIERRAETKGADLVLRVLDRGPGIPEEWLERVFEPFSRPERARTPEGGGAGLGLAIANTCMEGLGGRIRACNRPEGILAVELEFRTMVNGSKR